jgi:hypothetical protein
MNKDEALKLALEALNMAESDCGSRAWEREQEAITAIKQARSAPVQEQAAFNAGVPLLYPEMKDGETISVEYTTPPAAPVPEGWKMVPMEPTREMWTAVNKLDDQMAAGNYDGKGCSIEQAWNCLLDAAPTPPAPVPITPAEVHGMAEAHGIDGDARHWYVVGITDSEKRHGITKGQP